MKDIEIALAKYPVFLTNGSIAEVLKRSDKVNYNPILKVSGLVFDKIANPIMANLYSKYLKVSSDYKLPIIIHAPTIRSQKLTRIKHAEERCIEFARQLVRNSDANAFITGTMTVMGNSYDCREALDINDAYNYHAPHAENIAATGVSSITAVTLSSASEAIGVAKALASTKLPYILSFVIRSNSCLLDGIPINQVIEYIDDHISPYPIFYMVNCVHTSFFDQAMEIITAKSTEAAARIRGLRANTAAKSPEELENAKNLITEPPNLFASSMCKLQQKYNLKILGGCCGTNPAHMQAIAKLL